MYCRFSIILNITRHERFCQIFLCKLNSSTQNLSGCDLRPSFGILITSDYNVSENGSVGRHTIYVIYSPFLFIYGCYVIGFVAKNIVYNF
jgi:hypothetical protein